VMRGALHDESTSLIYLYNLLSLFGPSPAGLMTTSYCLILDSPNLEGQVPVFISPRNRMAQLCPRALGSFFVASYDSQGYGGGILTRLHTGFLRFQVQVQVQVTLRPTVSGPVFFSDNYFLYFSCRAPTLTKGRVCNLQCNDASSISSYISTDGLSASSSWYRAPNGAHAQILISLLDNYFLSYRCRAPSPISPMNRVIQPLVKVKVALV
jgi:hypothetical protein